jgi:hypothetical protein
VTLKGVEVNTRPERRDVVVGGRPSTGATGYSCRRSPIDRGYAPSSTALGPLLVVDDRHRRWKLEPDLTNHLHVTRSLLCSLETKGQQPRRLVETAKLWARTPVQRDHRRNLTSTGSPPASERNTNRTRTNRKGYYSMAPPPP